MNFEFDTIGIIEFLKFLCGIIVLFLAIIKILKILKSDSPEKVELQSIWIFGLLSLLLGLVGQILWMIGIFDAIAIAGDVSASVIAEGMSKASTQTVSGLVILIASLILWLIVYFIKRFKIKN